MEKKLLEVGDKIVVYNYGYCKGAITIDRVTRTMAFAGISKFKRETGARADGWVESIPYEGYGGNSYYLMTPERAIEVERKERMKTIRDRIKFISEILNDLNNDEQIKLLNFLTEFGTTKTI